MEADRRLWLGAQLLSLLAVLIGVEDEASRIEALQQDHAKIRHASGVHGGQSHGVRIGRFRARRFIEPGREKAQGFVGIAELTVC